jgi:CTP:molybdopterin cytidylyltransferase MocA
MDALIIAGGNPKPDDLLYEFTQGKPKALLDIAGKPMVQWVLAALDGSDNIDQIFIVGLSDLEGLTCLKQLHQIPDQGGMITNIKAGVKKIEQVNPEAKHVLVSAADIPAVTTEMVDWLIEQTKDKDFDLNYNVVERSVMESRFPGSKRTFTKLKGIQLCGGDMNIISTWTVTAKGGLWSKLEAARKNVFKQAALIGYDTLFLIIFRLKDFNGIVRYAEKKLGMKLLAIQSPYAEIAMDVDKPHQLEIIRKDLEK